MLKNYVGKKFGRWTVIGKTERLKDWVYVATCQCDCGAIKTLVINNLRRGLSRSCGCYRKEQSTKNAITHGLTRTKVYRAYTHMKDRCHNKNDKRYNTYGKRGIKICKKWNKFENFLKDMGQPPENSRKISIDRIDNDKGYSPSNCRWATDAMQTINRSNTVKITYKGVTKPLVTWAKEAGIAYSTLRRRYVFSKWSAKDALETPIRKRMK